MGTLREGFVGKMALHWPGRDLGLPRGRGVKGQEPPSHHLETSSDLPGCHRWPRSPGSSPSTPLGQECLRRMGQLPRCLWRAPLFQGRHQMRCLADTETVGTGRASVNRGIRVPSPSKKVQHPSPGEASSPSRAADCAMCSWFEVVLIPCGVSHDCLITEDNHIAISLDTSRG